ncbi:MAG: class I SAM-dependent methyltransferase [Deltaproteobacteria bacterium]|nr:class I SAM-dependent methyltransferase [Deltaproteobacteria bacterium]
MRRALDGIRQRAEIDSAVPPPPTLSSTEFWTENNVTRHQRFSSVESSLAQLDWRNGQYFDYTTLMPPSGHDGKVILDYGCGPGIDLVAFGSFSRPSRLVGADVSAPSLVEARDRLALHEIKAELLHLRDQSPKLPFPDATFDLVHSSGVIHHVEDPVAVLRELRRVLKPDGQALIMVYNYQSVFVHLYIAYTVQLVEGRFRDASLKEAFRELTDGPGCPISRAYRPEEFLALATQAGFGAEHTGNSVAALELAQLMSRGTALIHPGLGAEQRAFLRKLELDRRGLPMIDGQYAGVDACFRLRPKRGP